MAREGDLDGRHNFRAAVSHCSHYLQQQLDILKPRVIISLGNRVSTFFDIKSAKHVDAKSAKHGILYEWKGLDVVHSTFPSRNTADYWVQYKGWTPVLNRITSILR